MLRELSLALAVGLLASCVAQQDDTKATTASTFSVVTTPVTSVHVVGIDTLSDSASIRRIQPEPDGGSVAFLFADPAKGITAGLGLVSTTGNQTAQLAWPDSVTEFWWSGPHQLSFTAGTGRGVRVVVDAHAAQLQALEASGPQTIRPPGVASDTAGRMAESRAQAFIDSVRVQPSGTPQRSSLRYQVDSVLAVRDSLAAVHVVAKDIQGTKVNPAWYVAHLPSGHVQAIDSLTGRSAGLPATAGQWGGDGAFYYAKERSIWRAQPSAQRK